jgi:hypothetical protein
MKRLIILSTARKQRAEIEEKAKQLTKTTTTREKKKEDI